MLIEVQGGTDRNIDDPFDPVIGDPQQEIPSLASPARSDSGTDHSGATRAHRASPK
ncbi:hypothetical protein [Streptomyces sp. SM11]|uniref:hypothetical protein n=1 Tax=Streptomyces sp. SM11 TaxID=565557 RepID=UPI0015E1686C|nr:hypothetical protein [Streptomyces sp. SM11]